MATPALMTLPHLLLVDDSEAILAYEKASLGRLYTLTTAVNGIEALERARAIRPAAVLLDLSMPEMNGEEVLRRIRADPTLAHTPVVIVSSEHARGRACIAAGATAFLPKPIRADDLVALVARVLEEEQQKSRRQSLAVLFVGVGSCEVAIPLACVRTILPQVETRPLPSGPTYVREFFTLAGEPIAILDLARRLRIAHAAPLIDRKLVVVEVDAVRIALSVDSVRDPEELEAANVVEGRTVGAQRGGILDAVIMALVKTSGGPVPVIAPLALTSRALLRQLPRALEQALSGPLAPAEPRGSHEP